MEPKGYFQSCLLLISRFHMALPSHGSGCGCWGVTEISVLSAQVFSATNLTTFYKAQTRPALEYGSHGWDAAAPTSLLFLGTVQIKVIHLVNDPMFTNTVHP